MVTWRRRRCYDMSHVAPKRTFQCLNSLELGVANREGERDADPITHYEKACLLGAPLEVRATVSPLRHALAPLTTPMAGSDVLSLVAWIFMRMGGKREEGRLQGGTGTRAVSIPQNKELWIPIPFTSLQNEELWVLLNNLGHLQKINKKFAI